MPLTIAPEAPRTGCGVKPRLLTWRCAKLINITKAPSTTVVERRQGSTKGAKGASKDMGTLNGITTLTIQNKTISKIHITSTSIRRSTKTPSRTIHDSEGSIHPKIPTMITEINEVIANNNRDSHCIIRNHSKSGTCALTKTKGSPFATVRRVSLSMDPIPAGITTLTWSGMTNSPRARVLRSSSWAA